MDEFQLPISQVKLADPWHRTPSGTLLWCRIKGSNRGVSVGMHCRYNSDGNELPVIFVLSGQHAGIVISKEQVFDTAYDLSGLGEITLKFREPQNEHAREGGIAYTVGSNTKEIFFTEWYAFGLDGILGVS